MPGSRIVHKEVGDRRTTDGATYVLISYLLADNCKAGVRAVVIAKATTAEAAYFDRVAACKRTTGSQATLIDLTIDVVAARKDAGALSWAAGINVSENSVVIQITGEAGKTIDWMGFAEFFGNAE